MTLECVSKTQECNELRDFCILQQQIISNIMQGNWILLVSWKKLFPNWLWLDSFVRKKSVIKTFWNSDRLLLLSEYILQIYQTKIKNKHYSFRHNIKSGLFLSGVKQCCKPILGMVPLTFPTPSYRHSKANNNHVH